MRTINPRRASRSTSLPLLAWVHSRRACESGSRVPLPSPRLYRNLRVIQTPTAFLRTPLTRLAQDPVLVRLDGAGGTHAPGQEAVPTPAAGLPLQRRSEVEAILLRSTLDRALPLLASGSTPPAGLPRRLRVVVGEALRAQSPGRDLLLDGENILAVLPDRHLHHLANVGLLAHHPLHVAVGTQAVLHAAERILCRRLRESLPILGKLIARGAAIVLPFRGRHQGRGDTRALCLGLRLREKVEVPDGTLKSMSPSRLSALVR